MKTIISMLSVCIISMVLLLPRPGYTDDVFYGWQLMTEAELAEHSAKMRSFSTDEEREQYRKEHHNKMLARAKEKGVTLADNPRRLGGRNRGVVYGWQLMNEQERIEHRNKMKSIKDEREREQYRIEHHRKMQARAKAKGITLTPQGTFNLGGTDREGIFGWQLMSPKERVAHREKMRSFRSAEERQNYRRQHHKKMAARAKQKGITLVDPWETEK